MNSFLGKVSATATIAILIHTTVAPSISAFTITGAILLETKDTPICYMKLENGKIKDLTRICGFIKPQACSGTLGSDSRDRVLNEFCQQNEKCLLTNTCNAQPIAPYGPRPGEAAG